MTQAHLQFAFELSLVFLVEFIYIPPALDDCSKDVTYGKADNRGNPHHEQFV